jgi:transcriptional regulator with GAF, ATPase, and Fis domain
MRMSSAAEIVALGETERQFVGTSPGLVEALRRIEQVACTDSTVLIQGETGTGKELVAKLIHEKSRRHRQPFVKLNVAAIPASLLESELFGHEKGAFTGAITRRIGRFEEAQHGTIFLDEVGELEPELQPKLLRLLQEREFQRLGGSQTQRCDVRLITATNRDLRALVETGGFRADLFYRLNVFPIQVPPLRERREDIAPLARHFLSRLARKLGKPPGALSSRTLAKLEKYTWPGNIRELENVIERALVLWNGGDIEVELDEQPISMRPLAHTNPDDLQAVARTHILRVLDDCRWVIGGANGAAARLGMKRTTLNARLKKLGIMRL